MFFTICNDLLSFFDIILVVELLLLVLVLEVTEVSGFRGELLVEVGCFVKVFLNLKLVELSLLILILDLLL